MTTFVSDGITVSIDSRSTRRNIIVTDKAKKAVKGTKGIYFMVGDSFVTELMIDAYDNDKDYVEKIGGSSIYLLAGGRLKAIFYDRDMGRLLDEAIGNDELFSNGSGGDFALGAIHCGKSTKQACEIAMAIDNQSGGKVHTYEIATGKYLK